MLSTPINTVGSTRPSDAHNAVLSNQTDGSGTGASLVGRTRRARRSEPGFRRPLLVVQDDAAKAAGLPKDSVANVSQIITLDRDFLTEPAGKLRGQLMKTIEDRLRLVLSL